MKAIMFRRVCAFIINGESSAARYRWESMFSFNFLIFPAYFIAFDLLKDGITLSKSTFKIRVVAGGNRGFQVEGG